jgi:hypothetical protein
MSILYSLEVATSATADEVAARLHTIAVRAGIVGPGVTPPALLADGAVTRTGLWVRTVRSDPRPYNPMITELGIVQTVGVACRPDGHHDVPLQLSEMVWLSLALLAEVGGDAALHREYEAIWLVRRDGVLTVSDDDDIWPADRLAMVPRPYTRAPLSFSMT